MMNASSDVELLFDNSRKDQAGEGRSGSGLTTRGRQLKKKQDKEPGQRL